jgi:TonB-linked SusC/RagA family outer membrane protein
VRRFLSVVPLVAALLVPGVARAQGQATREITGKVTQAGTNTPVSDATVGLLGSPGGVRTNERGEYRLRVPATQDVTLLVRAIGFRRGGAAVSRTQTTADFALEKDVLQLEGVTVTGTATTIEKKNAATSVSTVSAEELTRAPAVSIENALQGKVVGARIDMNNGAPGGGAQVQIRGASSLIGNIQPLFVVDGVVVSNSVRSSRQSVATGSLNANEENGTNRVADINPNDIESIEVLKSTAAAAMYGSQATNGVVIITTKRGKAGAPRFNLTQRGGTYQAIRLEDSRHFETLDELLAVGATAGNPDAQAAARSVCTPNCPYHNYQKEMFGRTDPSYETVGSLSGGVGSTRYFVSGFNRFEAGTAMNTDAKRQSLRANVDQNIGAKITVGLNANMLRSFAQRGVSNNDNTFSSPLYAFGYTPAVLDLKDKQADGTYRFNPFPPGGVKAATNPFQTFDLMRTDEDVYRLIGGGRVNYSAWTGEKGALQVTASGGVDRFSNENYVYAPTSLQFQAPGSNQAGSFPGVAIQGNGTELNTSFQSAAVFDWNFGSLLRTTAQGGIQYTDRTTNDYNITGRGLAPQQFNANGAANTAVAQTRTIVRNQSYFGQLEGFAFSEKLYVSGAVRSERSSVNGDPNKYYIFPRGAASYRFVSPLPYVNEIKLRGAYGLSGNQPNYGDRFLTVTNGGLIDGRPAFYQAANVGNATIKPETQAETEFGTDVTAWNERVRFEATYFQRNIKDLLVRPVLAPSSGVSQTIVNGGEMKSKGTEIGLTIVPVQLRNFTWTSRTTHTQNYAEITTLGKGVLPFTLGAQGGFGNSYGRLRFQQGARVSEIYGYVDGVPNTPIGDANPKYLMQFGNDFTYKAFALNVLVDYRRGGAVSNMTLNLFDEGENTWDYENKSPQAGVPLGKYRYDKWSDGNTGVYVMDGSYTKVREISLSWDVPRPMLTRLKGVNTARLNLSGRNLFIISAYNGLDPEVNNGGQQVARFVDLAPWPPVRSMFLSIDLGF